MHKNNEQIELLTKIKNKFFKQGYKNKKKDYSALYLSSNANIGVYYMNSLMNKKINIIKKFVIISKEIIYGLKYNSSKIFIPTNLTEYKKIIITWAFRNDFNKDGSFIDRYLKINSKSLKKTLWIVIYMDENNPTKHQQNIILFKPITKTSLNIFPILKLIYKNFFKLIENPKYFLFSISNYNYFSIIFLKRIKKFLNKNVDIILMPYEAQPFQNQLIKFISEKYKKIKTIGYVHTPPMALPANFFHRNNSPKKIILNGKDQIFCFTKYLGWNKKKILFFPSFRFFKSKSFKKDKKIYLPLSIQNINQISKSLQKLYHDKIINIKEYKIKSHPAAINSKKNNKVLQILEKTIKNLNTQKSNFLKKNYLIFIGASGAIIEALENGSKVIQVCDNKLFDRYSEKIWPSIKSEKILDNVFSYKLRKKQNMIKFGSKIKTINHLKRIG